MAGPVRSGPRFIGQVLLHNIQVIAIEQGIFSDRFHRLIMKERTKREYRFEIGEWKNMNVGIVIDGWKPTPTPPSCVDHPSVGATRQVAPTTTTRPYHNDPPLPQRPAPTTTTRPYHNNSPLPQPVALTNPTDPPR